MADLSSTLAKMNDTEVAPDAPLSEALLVKIGENINGLIDENDARIAENAALLVYPVSVVYPTTYTVPAGFKFYGKVHLVGAGTVSVSDSTGTSSVSVSGSVPLYAVAGVTIAPTGASSWHIAGVIHNI
jgi:hypothetical protein